MFWRSCGPFSVIQNFFHTDNGNEFTAREIISFVKSLNPNILSVTGRKRRPSDQGCIERVNAVIEQKMNSLLDQLRMSGVKNPNWVRVLPQVKYMKHSEILPCLLSIVFLTHCSSHDIYYQVTLAINCMGGKDKNNISPYESVFGMPYHDSITSTLEEASHCVTVEERQALLPDTSFKKLAELTCDLRDEESEYDEEEEKKNASPWDPETDDEYNLSIPSNTNTDKNQDEVIVEAPLKDIVAGSLKGRKQDNNKRDFTYLRKFGVQDAFSSGKATVIVRNDEKQYGFIYPRLECDCCLSGEQLLSIGNDDYLKSCGEGSTKWYESDFIGTFGTLVAHCRHKTDTPADVQLVHIPHPNAKVTKKDMKTVKSGIKKLVACMYAGSHFAVMELDVGSEDVFIFDGLSYPLDYWIPHVKNMLARCSLLDGEPEEVTIDVQKENVEVRVTSGNISWSVKSATFIKQNNSYECGPIACAKLMDSFGLWDAEYDCEEDGLRGYVIESFKKLLKFLVGEIFVSPPVIELDDDNNDDDVVTQCCVCMENISSNQCTEMECCGKSIHAVCVSNWLENHPSCPLCRETVQRISFQGRVVPFCPQLLDVDGSDGKNVSSNDGKNINMEIEGEADLTKGMLQDDADEKNKNIEMEDKADLTDGKANLTDGKEQPETPEMEERSEIRLDNIKKASAIKRARQDNQAEKMKKGGQNMPKILVLQLEL